MRWIKNLRDNGEHRLVKKFAWFPLSLETYDKDKKRYVFLDIWFEKYYSVEAYDSPRMSWRTQVNLLPEDKDKVKFTDKGGSWPVKNYSYVIDWH
jgi:hypothetical protein